MKRSCQSLFLPRCILFFGLFSSLVSTSAWAQLPSGNWQYHWGDDFSGNTLDTTKWSYNYPWGSTHNHDAVMSSNNVLLGDGTLTLEARRTGTGADFTSGAISTGYNRFTFNGGYVEARIKLPSTKGSWPAFWGLFDGWPPEADIMEYPIDTASGNGYSEDEYHTAWHYSTGSGNAAGGGRVNPSGVGDLGDTYHNFGMHWIEDDWVGFYFDGQLVQQFGNDAAIAQMERMYLILNYAVGGWPGTPNLSEWAVGHSDQMKVDFVRIWKEANARSTAWNYTGTSEYVQWDSAGNWTNGSPNLGGVTASFNTVTNVAEQRIDWSGRRTLSVMNLDGETRYRFGWPDDRLVFGYGNNGNQRPTINIAATTTAEHEIYSQLEIAGGLSINNNSNQRFLLTGDVLGAGGIRINGPGGVVFAGNNSYSGDTIIDSGTQSPALAIASSSNPFGIGGRVIIGQGGNNTTGRLELENNAIVNNEIVLNGRNNGSTAIRNTLGNNTLAGRISLGVGGGDYIIESASGQLEMSGTQAGGIALWNGAGGTRTVTLDGSSNGWISGNVENGSGTLQLNKTGSGSWTLSGSNSYSGITSIQNGTLLINGTHTNAGSYDVHASATLGGSGTVVAGSSASISVDGRLAPGNSLGELTFGSDNSSTDVVLGSTGELWIEIGASGESDLLSVHGTLDLSAIGNSLHLTSLTGSFDGSEYEIATFQILSGQFEHVYLDGFDFGPSGALGNGYVLNYDTDEGRIFLSFTPIPEPSFGCFLLFTTLPLTRRRSA